LVTAAYVNPANIRDPKICRCERTIDVPDDALKDKAVFMYYSLSNYYQVIIP